MTNAKVANHLGAEPGAFEPGSWYGPFTAEEHFHPFCIPDDWDNQVQSEQCGFSFVIGTDT